VHNVNKRGQKDVARVRLANGDEFKGRGLRIDGDSISTILEDGEVVQFSRWDVDEISFRDRLDGAFYGAGLGLAIGFGIALAVGEVASEPDGMESVFIFDCLPCGTSDQVTGSVAPVMFPSTLLGLLIGTASGLKATYKFTNAPDGRFAPR